MGRGEAGGLGATRGIERGRRTRSLVLSEEPPVTAVPMASAGLERGESPSGGDGDDVSVGWEEGEVEDHFRFPPRL